MEEREVLFFDEVEEPKEIVRQCDACLNNVFFNKGEAVLAHLSYRSDFNTVAVTPKHFIVLTTTAIAMVNEKTMKFLKRFSQKKPIDTQDRLTQKFIEHGFLKQEDSVTPKYEESIDKLTYGYI